jgi:hypothetical protein
MRKSRWREIILTTLLTTAACGCAHELVQPDRIAPVGTPAESAEPRSAASGAQLPSRSENPTEQSSGLVVHIDPITGQILPKPPVAPTDPLLDPQQFQSGAAIPYGVEVASPVPGGGVKVNLHRQFHHPLFATIDSAGKVRFEHRPADSNLEVK